MAIGDMATGCNALVNYNYDYDFYYYNNMMTINNFHTFHY